MLFMYVCMGVVDIKKTYDIDNVIFLEALNIWEQSCT